MIRKNKITAIIPTLNEEIHIQAAIDSVSFADEIIVIDSFSRDKTIEITKKNKVRVLQREFDDFSSQKNYAIERATHNWIYILDADERVTDLLRQEIIATLNQPNECVGFFVFRTFYFLGKKLNYSGWQRDKVIRLFNREFCKYDGELVHETIEAKGNIGYLKNKLEHYSYRGYDHYVNKLNHYSALKAKSLFEKGKKVTLYHILIKPPTRFMIHYIIRLGFLDGFPGFVISTVHANGVLTRYIKLWILRSKL
ncbi:glycosyltransferase family 2 protein [Aureibaculum algae]|uniref:Glycosyltransferase family 2 protein n=1 Tax=Aureibaculum algae TaxID=2584122 RepID=A0A5B7TPE0_9FLAO|nr:glycosyltransferase family 2 protein [Aureibaculum algae]QCX38080.1 glycosyltransferase family 2 protein [Aureibaculum algae]